MKLIKYNFRLSGVILLLIFSICAALPSVYAQDNPNTITKSNTQTEVGNKVIITGTLLSRDGLPLEGKEVYLFLLTGNKLSLNIKNGKLVNPSGKTNIKGQFTIEADQTFLKEEQAFTVGIRNPFGELSILQHDGFNVNLQFSKDDKTRRFDIGKVSEQ